MRGTDLAELIASQVRLGSPDEDRVSINGPFLFLGAQEADHLGMVLHELTTNARKYGALVGDGRTPRGELGSAEQWRPQACCCNGRKATGRKCARPTSRGFGMTLIEQTVRVHGGEASMHFAEDGLKCRIDWPLAEAPQETVSTATMQFGELVHPADAGVSPRCAASASSSSKTNRWSRWTCSRC